MSSTICIETEFDLHTKVVEFIRKKYPHVILVPGLGELQTSDESRIQSWQKGYTAGQPDLMLLKPNSQYHGMAIEFKTPKTHELNASFKQKVFLAKLKKQGYKVVLSNRYEEILFDVISFMSNVP